MIKNARFSKMGRQLSRISLIILGGLLPVAAAAPQNPPNVDVPTGNVEDVRIEHNVTMNARKGMLIHAKISVQNALNKPCRLMATFEYNDGRRLKGTEAAYKDSAGNVVVAKYFTPPYARANYADMQLFMPYEALNMGSGKAALRFFLDLYDVNGKRSIAKSGYVNFNYSK